MTRACYVLGMTHPPELTRLRDRRKVIADNIGSHRIAISALEAEDRELEIAERVFLRFSGDADQKISELVDTVAAAGSDDGKPADIPTFPEMITESLRHAIERGHRGMEPSQMVSYVRQRWWPDVPATSIGPIAWRMWKRGDLIKDGGVYRLPTSSPRGDAGAVAAPAFTEPTSQSMEAAEHGSKGNGVP